MLTGASKYRFYQRPVFVHFMKQKQAFETISLLLKEVVRTTEQVLPDNGVFSPSVSGGILSRFKLVELRTAQFFPGIIQGDVERFDFAPLGGQFEHRVGHNGFAD